jgi:mannose-1-phosphate guanylyltransferase
MVLAAGYGTRLAPLTDELPKALCPIGDRPQIDHVLAHLAASGVSRAVVNVHHLAEHFDTRWRAAQPLPIELSNEPAILGTGGGIKHAAELLGEGDVLVWNADILADVDVRALVAAHRASGSIATLAVRELSGGKVGLDAAGRVVRLRQASFGNEASTVEYLGISVLGQELRRRLPERGCLIADGLIPALALEAHVGSFLHRGEHRDTGSVAEYLDANLAWLAGREAFAAGDAAIDPEVRLDRSIVGREARVGGRGVLEQCVVWPGAAAFAPLSRAVVTLRGTVAVGPDETTPRA